MGIADFSLFQVFTACNMLIYELRDRVRGSVLRYNNMVKMYFYSAVDEEFLSYIDYGDTNTCFADKPKRGTSH